MKQIAIALLALLIGASAVHAQTSEAPSNAEILALALGLPSELEEARKAMQDQSRAEMSQMIEQMKDAGVSKELIDEMNIFVESYVRNVSMSWNSKEAATVYVTALAESMTDTEMKAAISYFSSSDGQGAKTSIAKASAKLRQYISSKSLPVSQAENARLIAKVIEMRKRSN